MHNDALNNMRPLTKALKTVWNKEVYDRLRGTLRRESPSLIHFTNTFPLISPAAYYAAADEGVPVVQSLHNYRLLCPMAQFLRNDSVCEKCLGKTIPWPAVVHGCYRDSRAASAVVSAMLTVHRRKQTWQRRVHQYIALTEFARAKFVEGGLPANRISVKPNFVDPDPHPGEGRGGYALFVGRLSPEKGIETLLQAWKQLPIDLPLKIIGDGPMADRVRQAAAEDQRIEWLGRLPSNKVAPLVGEASFLVMPSIWYETFGLTIIEAFAKGTPVIASRLGAMQELVANPEHGRLFKPGSADDLARSVAEVSMNQTWLEKARQAVRSEYEQKYTAERNYTLLIEIYRRALDLPPDAANEPLLATAPREASHAASGT